MKTEITRQEYLILVGLYTLARQHNQKTEDAVDAIRETLAPDEPNNHHIDPLDHIDDAVWGRGEETIDPTLRRMGVTVREDEDDG